MFSVESRNIVSRNLTTTVNTGVFFMWFWCEISLLRFERETSEWLNVFQSFVLFCVYCDLYFTLCLFLCCSPPSTCHSDIWTSISIRLLAPAAEDITPPAFLSFFFLSNTHKPTATLTLLDKWTQPCCLSSGSQHQPQKSQLHHLHSVFILVF